MKVLAKKGEVVALEVNMRPCGGFTPDMINFANSTNVYKIWADMIAYDSTQMPVGEHFYCAYAGRRDGKDFTLSHGNILEKYGYQMKMIERIPDVLAGAMGNQMYVANFSTPEQVNQYYSDMLREKWMEQDIPPVIKIGEDVVEEAPVTEEPVAEVAETPAVEETVAEVVEAPVKEKKKRAPRKKKAEKVEE